VVWDMCGAREEPAAPVVRRRPKRKPKAGTRKAKS
jgi:hypothetical protein